LFLPGLIPDKQYLEAFRSYWPWSLLPQRPHRPALMALGLLFPGGAGVCSIPTHHALVRCSELYAAATKAHDSLRVALTAPDPALTPFGSGLRRPATCRDLRRPW
jgi:hypothetical protein